MPDFWPACGYRHLAVTGEHRLAVTDDFLRMYLLRPELAPIAESCDNELRLHEALLAEPRAAVPAPAIDAVADADVRDNFRIWLRFRDRLLAADTLEAAYARLFQGAGVDVAPLFVHQLTQILCRHVLGAAADPLEARVAECLFRAQRISVLGDGAVMAADDETVERFATDGGFGAIGELLQKQRTPLRTVDLDVLSRDNADSYWARDERFDTAVSLNRGQPALDALCRVLERWVAHFHSVRIAIRPQQAIDDKKWVWHIGLDAEASGILNDLYNEADVDEERSRRLLCLFQLDFADPADMRPQLRGRPVYLAMAMDGGQRLRLKPQNLLLNLPLARAS
ncbi:MAG: hypothetical protein IPO58_01480 [Betaproteobacteria bacterium]|nr:hypothetical protein [Betaproteobacteria bacterium]